MRRPYPDKCPECSARVWVSFLPDEGPGSVDCVGEDCDWCSYVDADKVKAWRQATGTEPDDPPRGGRAR